MNGQASVATKVVDDIIDIEIYTKIVDMVMKQKIEVPLPCSELYLPHVLKKIFEMAEKSVLILDNNFKPSIYDNPEVIDAAKAFLKKRNKKIVAAYDGFTPLEDILKRDFIRELSVKKEGFEFYDSSNEGTSKNIIIMDNSAIRCQTEGSSGYFRYSKPVDSIHELYTSFLRLIEHSIRMI